jgi:hypothetical protein
MFLQTLRLKTKSADNQPAKIALTSVSMAILMPLPALLLFLPGLDALRGHEDLAAEQNSNHWPWLVCRTSKCSDEEVSVLGDLKENVTLKNCQVKENKYFLVGETTMWLETCDVELNPAQKVTQVVVQRKSGKGGRRCQLMRGNRNKDLCQEDCCAAKCDERHFELKTVKSGIHYFNGCKVVHKKKRVRKGSSTGRPQCKEVCQVKDGKGHSGGEVSVLRESQDADPACTLSLFDYPVEEIGMWFIEQIETTALKLVAHRKKHLPWLKGDRVKAFLEKMQETMDQEMNKHGYSREIPAEHVVIIGDLFGQLFTLIAFLNKIKEHYADKGFKILDESSFLFCDPSIQYVFLGNYVQWGESSVEVLLLLLAYKARLAKSCDPGYKDRLYK